MITTLTQLSLPQPLHIHPLHYPIDCFCCHTCVPKGIPKTWNFCSITDLRIHTPAMPSRDPHNGEVDSITVSGEATTMSSKIRVPNPWHAFGLVQSYKHQFAWLLVQVTWSDPKNWWQKCGDPNFATERFSFEERELVDQELMPWVHQSKSNMSLNESLVSQEKPAWIKNESKKHVPYQYVPYERAERAL